MKTDSFIKKFSFINNFNNYPDAVIVIDYLNNITHWNKKACEIFGYSAREMMGRNIALLFDAEAEKIQEAVKTGKNFVLSSKNSSDEDIFVDISCKDLPGKKKILITARDVTKNQKIIEKLLVEYEKNLKISTQKSTFITGLSNDLKTPVHSLIGFSQGMLDGICGELNEKQLKYLTIMNKNANSLLEIITDLLELSKMEIEDLEFDMRIFDLMKSVNQVCERIKPRAEKKGLNFEADLSDVAKKSIYCDEEIFSKILSNVLENAVKFTEIGSVNLKVLHPDLDFVKTRGLEIPESFTDRSYLLFKVTDTGIGIGEEEIRVIFDEYSQTERNTAKKYGGTGLKLALTRKMLSRMGGVIWAESELGQGSTFNFIIPVERPQNPAQTEIMQETCAE